MFGNLPEKHIFSDILTKGGDKMAKELTKNLHYAMFEGFYDSSWEVQHDGCLMRTLANRLGMTIDARLLLAPMTERNVKVLFAIPKALGEEEVMKLFMGAQENLRNVAINVDEREDVTVFNLTYKDSAIEWLIDTPGILLQTYRATPEQEKISIWAPNIGVIESLRDGLNKIGKASIVSMKRVDRDEMVSRELLSPSQYRVLTTLLQQGFWNLPRKGITLEEIAPKLGMSKSNLSMIVRDIAGKVLEDYAKKMARLR